MAIVLSVEANKNEFASSEDAHFIDPVFEVIWLYPRSTYELFSTGIRFAMSQLQSSAVEHLLTQEQKPSLCQAA